MKVSVQLTLFCLFYEIPTYMLFIFVIHTRQQVKHEMKSHKSHTGYSN